MKIAVIDSGRLPAGVEFPPLQVNNRVGSNVSAWTRQACRTFPGVDSDDREQEQKCCN
jgi:hypothetical protein